MDTRGSFTEDISGWLTPRQALEILGTVFVSDAVARRELIERLRGGMVMAVCHHATIDGQRLKPGALNQLGSEDWNNIFSNDEVWITGTHSGSVYRSSGTYPTLKPIRFFDVRFKPDDINAIIAPHQVQPPNAAANDQIENNKPEADADYRKLPPVSEAHLKAWFAVYSLAYSSGPLDTLPNAIASARGMFPGRFVSRERVRDLAGGRTRGRKPR